MSEDAPCQRLGGEADPPAGRSWLSDVRIHWGYVVVRRTGRRIGFADVTPREFVRFVGWLAGVLVQTAQARSRGPAGRVWFTPHHPAPWYVVWAATCLSGVRFARSAEDADAVFYFEDVTSGEAPHIAGHEVLNGGCPDISKSRVAAAFEAVAGYPLALDPVAHRGPAVEKSEQNGAHDGCVVTCPLQPVAGRSYQVLVDSSDGATAFDYRTTIIGRKPLFVLVKAKPATDRFSIHNDRVWFAPIADIYAPAEIALITRFAETMKLDWAAIDVLRDRESGLIYIVDVNKTDTGPAVDLTSADREKVKRAIAAAFRTLVEDARQRRAGAEQSPAMPFGYPSVP